MKITDVFESIMTNVRAIYDPTNGVEPYFEYGHPLDISAKLDEKNGSVFYASSCFPMICLLLDVELIKGQSIEIDYKASPVLLFLQTADKTLHSKERLANTFVPVLHPMYDAFITAMKKCRYIKQKPEGFDHTYIDHLYWGKEGIKLGNGDPVFNQAVDGIEVKFNDLEFRIIKNC
jgi:hypothetical protein